MLRPGADGAPHQEVSSLTLCMHRTGFLQLLLLLGATVRLGL